MFSILVALTIVLAFISGAVTATPRGTKCQS